MEEIYITSAFQFFKIAHDIKKNRNHTSEIEFYRGHSDKSWRLLPSIYRRHLLNFEEDLINEYIRRRPDEFSESDGLFNIMAKMQHYGLYTRLLDVTENPAVALYFSCSENFDKDGELFSFQKSLDEIPNNTVLNILADFYIRHRNGRGHYNVKDYYDDMAKKHKEKDIEMAFYHIVNGYSCISRPKIISERIQRQWGSFMFFTDDVCPKENCRNEKCIRRDSTECKKDSIDKEIRERVKSLSIRGTMYDYTDLHTKYDQRGYRYIVKAENKKEILSELQTIGVYKAFLFPELNNVGIDIMDDYNLRIK